MLQFKYQSLFFFDKAVKADEVPICDLLRLYSLDGVAADIQMRTIFDKIKLNELRPAIRVLHPIALHGKVMEDFFSFDN